MEFSYDKLDHVQLAAPAGSENQAREFYIQTLMFTEVEKPLTLQKNGGVWFKAGDVQLHIGIDASFVPAKRAHPAIQVTNIEALMDHLKEKEISVQVDNRLPGAKRFYVEDPFENRLEFLQWA